MRGFNDFNLIKAHLAYINRVSVPMRGFNDFNHAKIDDRIPPKYVSVPMRGFNDFNIDKACDVYRVDGFRPHAGF